MKRIVTNPGELLGLLELGIWLLTMLLGPWVWMFFLIQEGRWTSLCIVLGCWLASVTFVASAVRRQRFAYGVLAVCVGWLIAVVMAFGFRSWI